jgi:hypothetical protein
LHEKSASLLTAAVENQPQFRLWRQHGSGVDAPPRTSFLYSRYRETILKLL